MASIRLNIVANMTGRIWSAVLTVLLVPVYIRFVGLESYGLIGFYTTLIASLAILDLGLSTTLNRELALSAATKKDPFEVRSLVLTLERVYWAVGLLIAILVIAFAGVIAKHWIKAEVIPVATVRKCIMLMGAVIAFQWPISIYTGGMMGLEKQVLYNVLLIVMTTLRAAGVLVLFMFVKPSIELFFLWQVFISFIYVISMRIGVWKYLPHSNDKPVFSTNHLKRIWRFATGMTGIGITAFLLAQVDKVILSKILPLTEYAYYTVAITLSSVLGTLITPVFAAVFPRFNALISTHNETELKRIYHSVSRLVATILFPIGLFVIFFASDLLAVWTKNHDTVIHATNLVQILTAAGILSGLASIPFLMAQAHGNTRFLFLQNLVGVIVLVPLIFIATYRLGALGGALMLLLMYTLYVFVSVPLINARYFKNQVLKWYIDDNLVPFLVPLIFLIVLKGSMHYFFPDANLNLFLISVMVSCTLFVSILFNPDIRQNILHYIHLKRGKKILI